MKTIGAFLSGESDDQDIRLDARSGLDVKDGLESLRQRVIEHLKLFRGEYYLDTSRGIPYFDEVFTRPVQPGMVSAVISSGILEKSPEVTGIKDIRLTFDTPSRSVIFEVTVDTVYGPMDLEGSLGDS